MFIEGNCVRCGTCLADCPYLNISKDQAIEEINDIINTKTTGKLLENCLGCAYCNSVCPNKSNPYDLIKEINARHIRDQGLPRFYIISDEIPFHVGAISMEFERQIKEKNIQQYLNPPKAKEMFYLGCGLSYIQTDLLKTKLLDDLPKIGGDKFCCAGYVEMFGEEEVKIKGRSLLKDFKELGVEKFIIFCPGCLRMMKGVYSNFLPEYQKNLTFQTFSQYLVEKYHKDELKFKHKINQRITFHDPCAWRGLDKQIFNAPREFLEIIGAEVVEMKHNHDNSLCCGASFSDSNKEFFKKVSGMRISEAEEVEAKIIAVSCTGCLALAQKSIEKNIETFHIIELAQMAIGEKPLHRIIELREKFYELINLATKDNPDLLKDKCFIKNGKILSLK